MLKYKKKKNVPVLASASAANESATKLFIMLLGRLRISHSKSFSDGTSTFSKDFSWPFSGEEATISSSISRSHTSGAKLGIEGPSKSKGSFLTLVGDSGTNSAASGFNGDSSSFDEALSCQQQDPIYN